MLDFFFVLESVTLKAILIMAGGVKVYGHNKSPVVAFIRSRSNGSVGSKCGRLPALHFNAGLANLFELDYLNKRNFNCHCSNVCGKPLPAADDSFK